METSIHNLYWSSVIQRRLNGCAATSRLGLFPADQRNTVLRRTRARDFVFPDVQRPLNLVQITTNLETKLAQNTFGRPQDVMPAVLYVVPSTQTLCKS